MNDDKKSELEAETLMQLNEMAKRTDPVHNFSSYVIAKVLIAILQQLIEIKEELQ